MTNVLVINSSALGAASVSRGLVSRIVSGIREADPAASVIERDLDAHPVPHLDGRTLAGFGGQGAAEPAALSDALIAELKAADVIVIGAPMYNFGIASTLKSWFDHVMRAGLTFRYTEAGPEGLVTGKRAIVALSRGGYYDATDTQEPHLRTMLGLMGITDVAFVRAHGLAFGPEARAQGLAAAEAEADAAVGVQVKQAA